MQHSNPSADSLGLANAAASIHGISHNGDTVQPVASRSRAQEPPPGAILSDKFINSFSGLMDNMASAATNYKADLEQLVANTKMEYTAMKNLLQGLKSQRGSNNIRRNTNTNSTNTNHSLDGDEMRIIKNVMPHYNMLL